MGLKPFDGPRTFRFRTDREPDSQGGARCWAARYSYSGGWAPFEIVVDFDRKVCSFIRAPDIPYGGLLCDLVETMIGVETSSAPLVHKPLERLSFPCRVIGQRMSRHADTGGGVPAANGAAAYFRDDPPGSWLVLQLKVPQRNGSFLLAISDQRGSGEIVSGGQEDGLAVIQAFTDAFADARGATRH